MRRSASSRCLLLADPPSPIYRGMEGRITPELSPKLPERPVAAASPPSFSQRIKKFFVSLYVLIRSLFSRLAPRKFPPEEPREEFSAPEPIRRGRSQLRPALKRCGRSTSSEHSETDSFSSPSSDDEQPLLSSRSRVQSSAFMATSIPHRRATGNSRTTTEDCTKSVRFAEMSDVMTYEREAWVIDPETEAFIAPFTSLSTAMSSKQPLLPPCIVRRFFIPAEFILTDDDYDSPEDEDDTWNF